MATHKGRGYGIAGLTPQTPRAANTPTSAPSGLTRDLRATAPRFYLARQSFVLPRHVEQTVAGFGNALVFRPLPELSRLFAVVRHALQRGPVVTRRSKIGRHAQPRQRHGGIVPGQG